MFALAAVAVVVRFLSRTPYYGGTAGWDDWTCLLTLLIMTASQGEATVVLRNGFGRDVWMLTEEQITIVFKNNYIAQLLCVAAFTTIKISILALYLRVFPLEDFRLQCHVLMVLSMLFGLAVAISSLLYCRPFSYTWLRWNSTYSGECIDISAQMAFAFIGTAALDVIIFLLPIPQLLTLRINLKKKIAVIVVMTAGLVASAFLRPAHELTSQFWTLYSNSHSTNINAAKPALLAAYAGYVSKGQIR
ncbi:putative Extracellular membrane protein CFEM domain-containing protein [Seiridium unicorne]|uniref:Extracellular membrane protein CFEM domain-containing protein n=1 Tax=Seiridium unicorne TaxID=138068 RepID=A0ABR2V9T3_9PEZI